LSRTSPPKRSGNWAASPGPLTKPTRTSAILRSLLWCSIDNDSSLDLDQLSVGEALPNNGVKVLVAIADVDALVKVNTPIDRHAKTNTTSIYTAAKIFAMLPERLSTDFTSLADNQDRLAMVVEMSIAADGSVTGSDIYRALVHNKAKLAYRTVAPWLEGHGPAPERLSRVAGLDENLRLQDRIAQQMRSVRYLHGSIDLETIEPQAVLAGGNVVDLRLDQRNRAKELIEDLMIATNGVTARFLEAKGWPVLQRIVRSPEHWDQIRKVAAGVGDSLPSAPDSKALAEFMTRRRQADALRFPDLSLTIVKLLGAGEYVVQAPNQQTGGHFGLAVGEYSSRAVPVRPRRRIVRCARDRSVGQGDVGPPADAARRGKVDGRKGDRSRRQPGARQADRPERGTRVHRLRACEVTEMWRQVFQLADSIRPKARNPVDDEKPATCRFDRTANVEVVDDLKSASSKTCRHTETTPWTR